jgi:squalene synthase HpnC
MTAVGLEDAFAHCEARVRRHYRGIPFGLLVPRERRRYAYALYAFLRVAHDFADEPLYEGMRAEKLEQWEALLDAACRGEAEGPLFVALGETVRRLDVPRELLLNLLSACRQDAAGEPYETWEKLLDHCRRAADPVGRLILLLLGEREAAFPPLSDALSTGLHLARCWQDAAIDYARGRLYVPEELMRRHGVGTWELSTGRVSDGFLGLMAELVARTRESLERGRPLCDLGGRPLRRGARLAWLAGTSILDRIEAVGADVFRHRPRHSALARATLLWRAWRWT